jgi:hypothetical protein
MSGNRVVRWDAEEQPVADGIRARTVEGEERGRTGHKEIGESSAEAMVEAVQGLMRDGAVESASVDIEA